MPQDARLHAITAALTPDTPITAAELARKLGVTERTIYRDIARLTATGLPVEGTPGSGYRLPAHVLLPPLTLTPAELEALNLGLAVAQELADPALAQAVETLTAKIDAAQPARTGPSGGPSPFTTPARGLVHLRPLRAAIKARQLVQVVATDGDGAITSPRLRPLALEHWGRDWVLTGYSESDQAFTRLRLDSIQSVAPLPELFADDPGKRLEDITA